MPPHAPATPPDQGRAGADFCRVVPYEFARRHLVLPSSEGDLLTSESTPPAVVHNLSVLCGGFVQRRLLDGETLAKAIDAAYASLAAAEGRAADDDIIELGSVSDAVQPGADIENALHAAEQDLLQTGGKGPVMRLVDLVLFEALQRSASDIHIQPLPEKVLVRYRLDGVLLTVRALPAAIGPAIVGRIKIMGRMDVAERRAPQDGRAGVHVGGGRRIDLRISTIPSTYGERVVVRVLDAQRSAALLSFANLGMPAPVEKQFKSRASRASGVVLVTGPTGSGKTTTLYTTLAWIGGGGDPCVEGRRRPPGDLNILTIEDPVEYDLSAAGIAASQTQVDPRKGLHFARGLRHILRQDPDVIMVGEIRDEETARIAVQASLTGHLVLSTLHTNDAAGAVARLLDLAVEPFLVSSSLSAVLAQRLVRRVHIACSGVGCESCMRSGFLGRVGIFELLTVDDDIRVLIQARAAATEIRGAATHKGMTTLLAAGRGLVDEGITTDAEVARVVQGAGGEDDPSEEIA